MPDARDWNMEQAPDPALVRMLRGLPPCVPDGDGWSRLAQQLASPSAATVPASRLGRRRVRRAVWWAAAAMLLITLALPRLPSQVPTPALPVDATAAAPAASPEAITSVLIAQSQWLENLVSAPAFEPGGQRSDQLLLEQGLRQRVGRIDAALASAAPAEAGPLWHARVDTLSQLAQVRWAGLRQDWSGGIADGGVMQPVMRWSN